MICFTNIVFLNLAQTHLSIILKRKKSFLNYLFEYVYDFFLMGYKIIKCVKKKCRAVGFNLKINSIMKIPPW